MIGNPSAGPKLGCLVALVVLILAASYLSVSSLNPLDVYISDSIIAKSAVSVFGALLALGAIQYVLGTLLRGWIRRSSGKPAEDVRCPGCELPLLPYVSSHGIPVICPSCKRFWHVNCYRKEWPPDRRLPPPMCPECQAGRGQDDPFVDLQRWN